MRPYIESACDGRLEDVRKYCGVIFVWDPTECVDTVGHDIHMGRV